MAAYNFVCSSGHTFESWFDSYRSCKEQLEKRRIACPVCHSFDVQKGPSSSAILTRSRDSVERLIKSSEAYANLRDAVKAYVMSLEDVGEHFTDEVLAMNLGERDKRAVRGTVSKEDLDALARERIDVFLIPDWKDGDEN